MDTNQPILGAGHDAALNNRRRDGFDDALGGADRAAASGRRNTDNFERRSAAGHGGDFVLGGWWSIVYTL